MSALMSPPTEEQPKLPWWYVIMVDFIAKVGFPVAITVYLLFRFDGQMNMLITQVNELIRVCGPHA